MNVLELCICICIRETFLTYRIIHVLGVCYPPYLCAVDNHCVKLVHEYHAVEPLIHVVRKATDLKASHAATGVLRNLALAGNYLYSIRLSNVYDLL